MATPTEAEMMADLAAADASGDVELAQHIAGRIKAARTARPEALSSHAGRAPYEPPKTGRFESGVRGALQGASFGWADEGAAAIDAALPSFLRNETSAKAVAPSLSDVMTGNAADTYGARRLRARDFYRNRNATAEDSNPGTYLAGQIGGAALPALVGAPAAGAVKIGSVALPRAALAAAGQGVAQGAGYSEDEGLGLARDTALGGGLGVAGHGVGTLVGKGAAWAGRAGRELVRKGTARAGTQAAEESAKALASETGRLGGFSQDLNREVEWVIRLLDEEKGGTLSAANKAALEAFRKSPAFAAVVNKAAERVMTQAPAAVARTGNQEAVLAAMQQAQPAAVAARSAELLKPQIKADLKSFAKAYAEPMAWAVGGQQVGSALGLDPAAQGALAGAAGLVGGRTRAGKALWTRLNRPAHQTAAGRALENLSSAATGSRAEALRRLMEAGVPAAGIAAIVEGE
jgi:hypothetical protein